jgi:hypothetical protein
MRTIEIIYDARNLRPWLALDRETGETLIRQNDRDQLERRCTQLGWHIASLDSSASEFADLANWGNRGDAAT